MKTISKEYLELQKKLHLNPDYGIASLSFAPIVSEIIKKANINTVSDYGAGKKNLLIGIQNNGITDIDYFPYDPAFPEYGEPVTSQLVCCIDVLEHIEPELIDNVIQELASIITNLGFFSIHMGPAKKILADGFNMLDPIKATIITPGLNVDGEFSDEFGIPASIVTKYLAEHGVIVEISPIFFR